MFFEQLENDIVTRLKSKRASGSQVFIEVFPETDQEYQRGFQQPTISVAYMESEFAPTKSTYDVVQDETQLVQLTIRSRERRTGIDSIYSLADMARKALVGWKTPHGFKTTARTFKLADRVEGVWVYEFVFAVPSMIVEDSQEDSGPPLQQPTLTPTQYS
jgi:hypothetical protein